MFSQRPRPAGLSLQSGSATKTPAGEIYLVHHRRLGCLNITVFFLILSVFNHRPQKEHSRQAAPAEIQPPPFDSLLNKTAKINSGLIWTCVIGSQL